MGTSSDVGILHSTIRHITYILSNTSYQALPSAIRSSISLLETCNDSSSGPPGGPSNEHSTELQILLHKFGTQITALLQGNHSPGHFVAAVLIKISIENSRLGYLQSCQSWTRGLLAALKKHQASSVDTACIITLARILYLCRSSQTLTRELSTPILPAFITTCLDSIDPKGIGYSSQRLLESIFSAFSELIPLYPSTFRPYATRIQRVLLLFLAPISSADHRSYVTYQCRISPAICRAGRRLFVRLHFCASKGVVQDEWAAAFNAVRGEFHETADLVFRAVLDGQQHNTGSSNDALQSNYLTGDVQQGNSSPMGLPSWTSITQGTERLIGLLSLLREFFTEKTASVVFLSLGMTTSMLSKIFLLTASPRGIILDSWRDPAQPRPDIGRDEREGLWIQLPTIHIAGMKLILAIIHRLKSSFLPLACETLQQVVQVFEIESWNIEVKTYAYAVVSKLLLLAGRTMSNETIFSLSPMMRQGCVDLLQAFAREPNQPPVSGMVAKKARRPKQAAKVSTFEDILPGQDSPRYLFAERKAYLQTLNSFGTAWALLPVYLARVPSGRTDFALRAQIDRTAILIRHKSAAIASVLYPMQLGDQVGMPSSIIPFLARAHGDDQEVEGLLRPRMPTITIPTLVQEVESYRTSEIHSPIPESRQAVSFYEHTEDGPQWNFTSRYAPGSPQPTVARSLQPTQDLHVQPMEVRQSSAATETVPLSRSRQTSVHRFENETGFAYNVLQPTEPIFSTEDTHIDKRPRLEDSKNEILRKSFGAPELPQKYTEEVRVYRTGDPASAAIDLSSAALTVSTTAPNLERQDRESDDEFVIPTLCLDTDSEDGQGFDQGN